MRWDQQNAKYGDIFVYLKITRLGHMTRAWTSGVERIWRWALECGNVEALLKSYPALMWVMSSGDYFIPKFDTAQVRVSCSYLEINASSCTLLLSFQRQVTLHFPWRSGQNCQQECCQGGRGKQLENTRDWNLILKPPPGLDGWVERLLLQHEPRSSKCWNWGPFAQKNSEGRSQM